MELMKNKYYNDTTLHELALRIKGVYDSFQVDDFICDIMDEVWDDLELKNRMRKITINLGKYLPNDYRQALAVIDKVIEGFPEGLNDNSFIYFPDFVEVFGQDECHWELSIAAIERYTISSTAEFVVRAFILNNEERMMAQMAKWVAHENEHVRRLASEGCRPALPWGKALLNFKKDPSSVLKILEQLKADPSLYVRKSVANNLNDISKNHPDLIVKIAKDWYGKNEYTNWIVRHGCRTLLKKGNKDVLEIFGFLNADNVKIKKFIRNPAVILVGNDMNFSFVVSVKKTTKLRLEYGIDYVKASGKRSRKIFQISMITLKENQEKKYSKTHSFKNLSSRVHYPGIHSITLIINGTERDTLDFELIATNN